MKFADVAGSAPITGGFYMLDERHVSSDLADTAFWIPGDWGFIRNKGIYNKALGSEGENMIYLGGCYETNPSKFSEQAHFWGHGLGELTLDQMLALVGSWNDDAGSELTTLRFDFNIPILFDSLKRD